MLSVEQAMDILNELFESELKASLDERCLGSDELVALQTLYDYVKHLEGVVRDGREK